MTPDTGSLRLLLRARWVAVACEGVAIALASPPIDGEDALPLATLVGGHALTNVLLALRGRSVRGAMPAALFVDVAALSGVLALTGGASNPFSALYFVQVVLGAVLLAPGWVVGLWLAAVGGYGALFALPAGPHAHHMGPSFQLHLYGMWLAFAIASGLLGFFVSRLRGVLREREGELRRSRERAARSRRVAALTTLAAGAAHELGTPLATIAVVAGELERRLGDPALAEDAALIGTEVKRCRRILESMSAEAGDVRGEASETLSLAELAEDVAGRLDAGRRARLRVDVGEGVIVGPRGALARALANLLGNAFDASSGHGLVELYAADGALVVRDFGSGMGPEALAQATEPFFTTKDPGEGMGLGLFLTQATLEALGGTLELASEEGRGTTATLHLPRTPEGADDHA